MKMVIVGGGKIGRNLAKMMLERRHTVKLIEKDRAKCRLLANELDAEVILGDGSDVTVLESAETYNADCFMAVTGTDQDNLVASQLAKNHFRAKKVIARTNDPRNIQTYHILGILNTVSSTEIISNLIEQEADLSHMHLVATLNKGKAGVCSFDLPENTALEGRTLRDIEFPKGCLVISIIRNDELFIPDGSTKLHGGDEIVAVSENKSQKALMKILATIR